MDEESISGGSHKAVAYGNGKFAAVGPGDESYRGIGSDLYRRDDDTNFNAQLQGVAYGGGVFVAVGAYKRYTWDGNVANQWMDVSDRIRRLWLLLATEYPSGVFLWLSVALVRSSPRRTEQLGPQSLWNHRL